MAGEMDMQATAPESQVGADQPEKEFEVKLTVTQSEAEQAIELLRQGGMDQMADMLQQALTPQPPDEAQMLQDEIVAQAPPMR